MYISPVESCFFFHILSIYWLKFTSQQIPILSSKYPFFCFVEENALFIAKKTYQTKHRSRRIFPIASFLFCLSHTFITLIVTDIFILLCNLYGRGLVALRQWGLLFRNIHLLTKINPRLGVQISIIEQMSLFFCQHAQDQCVTLKRTHFAVPPLNTLSDKNNFNF